VVHHYFDVNNGKSVWIITNTDGKYIADCNYSDLKSVTRSIRLAGSSSVIERFECTLEVIVWLVEWALSDFGLQISYLDDTLEAIVGFLDPFRSILRHCGPLTNRLYRHERSGMSLIPASINRILRESTAVWKV
jgi:hypothetical protein